MSMISLTYSVATNCSFNYLSIAHMILFVFNIWQFPKKGITHARYECDLIVHVILSYCPVVQQCFSSIRGEFSLAGDSS